MLVKQQTKHHEKTLTTVTAKNLHFFDSVLSHQIFIRKFNPDVSSHVNSSWNTEATGKFFPINMHRDFLALSSAFRLCTIMANPNLNHSP